MKIQMHLMHFVYTWSDVFVYMAMYDAYQTNGNCDLSYVVIQRNMLGIWSEMEIGLCVAARESSGSFNVRPPSYKLVYKPQ